MQLFPQDQEQSYVISGSKKFLNYCTDSFDDLWSQKNQFATLLYKWDLCQKYWYWFKSLWVVQLYEFLYWYFSHFCSVSFGCIVDHIDLYCSCLDVPQHSTRYSTHLFCIHNAQSVWCWSLGDSSLRNTKVEDLTFGWCTSNPSLLIFFMCFLGFQPTRIFVCTRVFIRSDNFGVLEKKHWCF